MAHNVRGLRLLAGASAICTGFLLASICLAGTAAGRRGQPAQRTSGASHSSPNGTAARPAAGAQAAPPVPPYDFSAADTAIEKSIADDELPGAVLLVGYRGKVV